MSLTPDDQLSLRRLLVDGSMINAGLTAIILGSLYQDAEIWVQDYPPDVREKWGPKSKRARRLTILWSIPFMLVLFGGVAGSVLKLKQEQGGRLSFRAAFLHTYGLLLSFWLFDLVIIDWTLLGVLKPEFAILPGTEGMAGYEDRMIHLRTALPALPGMVLPAALIAFAVTRR